MNNNFMGWQKWQTLDTYVIVCMYILDGGTQIFGRGGGIPCQVQFHGCVKKVLFQTRDLRVTWSNMAFEHILPDL